MTASSATISAALPDFDARLEIPPPPPAHPLRLRRVLELLRNIHEADDQVEAGLELFDAVGGVGGERTFQRFLRRPEGEALLRSRPDLVALLGDREGLAALPEGSLGRAYLAFAEENGFAADGLVEKNKAVHREAHEIDPYRSWFWDRFTMAHDLWHVLTGCPATPEGEGTLLAFLAAHTPQRGYWMLVGLVTVGAGRDLGRHWRNLKAFRAGRRAEPLLVARWEELLAWPIEEVRRCFRVSELMS